MIVAAAAWWFLIASQTAMMQMTGAGIVVDIMRLMMVPSQTGPYFLATSLMWIVMMAAMMIPAVLPMVMIYRNMGRGSSPNLDAVVFSWGYLLAWFIFAIGAAGLQWWLHTQGALHGHLFATSAGLTGAIFLAAGVYQLTPFKDACLSRCRSPLGFFVEHWQSGRLGALQMGFRHGLYCTGCCWVLMLLMFASGTMNVTTMAMLSVFILAERLLPAGPWVSKIPGFGLFGWGGWC